ncbi:short-chain dehydrogenase [Salinibacillus xinjiangensis]|uniref:Short-chain dehydrogenase n=1 Tax=Salinibacillus xinjiangensis TaxID=1229268 RepID=A0A6G1X8K4_9BACI|nr:short-chain dehydrogenase [Salinibacillus xinjiangensis]MRG87236.1 short-chain dehydrogenase [Salinibacillus xinjiangensis]
MKHALVVGGTGMLADVTLWLNKKGYYVSVMGRRKDRYHKLMEQVHDPKRISSILVDYHNTDELRKRLMESIKEHGPYELVVAWVHSSAPEALPTLLQLQAEKGLKQTFDLYHVKSSTSYIKREKPDLPSSCSYHEVFLGFKLFGHHSRWLTHQEISDGVKDAIHHNRKETIVGQLEPWEKRPH